MSDKPKQAPILVGEPREPGQTRVDPIPFYEDKGAKMLRYGAVPFNADVGILSGDINLFLESPIGDP